MSDNIPDDPRNTTVPRRNWYIRPSRWSSPVPRHEVPMIVVIKPQVKPGEPRGTRMNLVPTTAESRPR